MILYFCKPIAMDRLWIRSISHSLCPVNFPRKYFNNWYLWNFTIRMRKPRPLLALVFGLCLVFASADKKPKIVSTLLNAKWQRTPFILEAAEFLASENNEYFWSLVDYFAESDNVDLESKISDEDLYKKVIEFCSR